MTRRWQYSRYGTVDDPVHKSHLNVIAGNYGCPKRFRYERDAELEIEEAERFAEVNGTPRAPARTVAGTAVHETIARALNNPSVCVSMLRGTPPADARVENTFLHELEVAADGREIDWGKDTADELIEARLAMLRGLFASLPRYVAEVVLVEPAFSVKVNGYELAGHVDLVYRPRAAPHKLALADWKTGKTKPHTIELQHSWEAGIYSAALRHGVFLPREHVELEPRDGGEWIGRCGNTRVTAPSRWLAERRTLEAALMRFAARTQAVADHGEAADHNGPSNTNDTAAEPDIGLRCFDEYPTEVHHVHLQDFVPYERGGAKTIERAEDLVFYERASSCKVTYKAGERRGPAWLPVELREQDIARLGHRLRTIIGTVRVGRFVDIVNEQCRRCPFARQCLNEGYDVTGDELAEVQANLKAAGL